MINKSELLFNGNGNGEFIYTLQKIYANLKFQTTNSL